MAYSKLLEEFKIQNAPYIRCAIVGDQGRLGKGAFYESKLGTDSYVLGGNVQHLSEQNDKDFFETAAFVEKILKMEVGGSQKPIKTFDTLIAEVLHALRFDSLSVEDNFNDVLEGEILRDREFAAAATAFRRLLDQGSFSDVLLYTEVDGFTEIVRNGLYGELRNQIFADERTLNSVNSKLSRQEQADLRAEIASNRNLAIDMQRMLKEEAEEVLKARAEHLKTIKARIAKLLDIANKSDYGTQAYERAVAEIRQIMAENKELLANDKKYSRAQKELEELESEQLQASKTSQKF